LKHVWRVCRCGPSHWLEEIKFSQGHPEHKILNKRFMLKGNRDFDWLTEEDWRDYLHCTKKVRCYDYEDGPLFSII